MDLAQSNCCVHSFGNLKGVYEYSRDATSLYDSYVVHTVFEPQTGSFQLKLTAKFNHEIYYTFPIGSSCYL